MADTCNSRIESFLNQPDRPESEFLPETSPLAAELSNATIRWPSQAADQPNTAAPAEDNPLQTDTKVSAPESSGDTVEKDLYTLRGVSLQVKKGSLVAVVGKVGSGKSCLLHGTLGELDILGGTITSSRQVTPLV